MKLTFEIIATRIRTPWFTGGLLDLSNHDDRSKMKEMQAKNTSGMRMLSGGKERWTRLGGEGLYQKFSRSLALFVLSSHRAMSAVPPTEMVLSLYTHLHRCMKQRPPLTKRLGTVNVISTFRT